MNRITHAVSKWRHLTDTRNVRMPTLAPIADPRAAKECIALAAGRRAITPDERDSLRAILDRVQTGAADPAEQVALYGALAELIGHPLLPDPILGPRYTS